MAETGSSSEAAVCEVPVESIGADPPDTVALNATGLPVVGFTWPIFWFVVGNEKSADRGDCRATRLFDVSTLDATSFVIDAKSGGEKTTARLLTALLRLVGLALAVPAWLLEIIRAGASTEDVETSSRVIAKRLI